ncbi:MAG TPA: hypothetical protein VNC50_00060, partial [Planctomycetia bacterium]|nr:hypothetical protein [Planctomycetia bacterium]
MSAALLILGLATFTGFDDDAIFEAPVAAQPFDKEPFRPVKIPHWVRGTLGVGYTLSGMDESARKRAVAHGVSISEMGFVDPFYAYYDSKLLKRRSPHVPLPRIREEIASYRRLGLRILGVYPPCLQSEVYESHPEWRRVAEDVRTIPTVDLKQHPYGGMLCLLGPYGDFFVEVLAEIAAMHPDVTAFSFDGLHYGGVCYCEHCRASFRKEAGREIPKANLDDPAFRRYQHWADRRMEDVVRRAQRRLKKLNPDLALVTWTTNAGRFGHFLSVPRNMPARMNLLLDAPDQELWLDETNRGATVVPAFGTAYAWSATDHRVAFSEPYLLSHGNPYGKDSFPAHEVLRRMLLSVTYGNGASIAVAQPKRLQEPVYRCLDEVKRRGPWLVHKEPERWAALLMSDNAKNFYARSAGRVEDRYLSAPLGAFRACVEEHLPVTLINDWNLTDAGLAPYSVLILPNAASVDERQAKAIAAFVRSGGGVVASLDASLFDEYGDPRSNFALADLLGVDFKGPLGAAAPKEALDVNFAKAIGPDYWEKRTNAFDVRFPPNSPLASTKLRELVGDEPVTFKGPAVRITARPGTDVAATIRAKDGTGPEFPAATRRREGKGTAIYFAAGLDHGYYAYAYPY